MQTFNDFLYSLYSLFNAAFETVCNAQDETGKAYMKKYYARIFSIWYHAGFVSGTILSPANIMARYNKQEGNLSYIYPLPKYDKQDDNYYDISFADVAYQFDDHVLCHDFLQFLKITRDGFNLTKKETLPAALYNRIQKKVSSYDSLYVDYLFNLSLIFDLFEPVDGLHVRRYEPTESLEDFIKIPFDEMYQVIIDASISFLTIRLNVILPGFNIGISRDFILDLLKNPINIIDIDAGIFDIFLNTIRSKLSAGDEFEFFSFELGEPKQSSEMTEQDIYSLFISCVSELNSTLAHFFFTVFGDYLRLIVPLYDLTFSAKDMYDYVCLAAEKKNECFMLGYQYSLTPLAFEYIERIGGGKVKPTNNTLNDDIPIDKLYHLVFSDFEKLCANYVAAVNKYTGKNEREIYLLRVTSCEEPEFWKTIEVSDSHTLEQMHNIICDEFIIEPITDYSFNTSTDGNLFTMYTSPANSAKHKKTNATILHELNLMEKSKLYHTVNRSILPYIHDRNREYTESDMYKIVVTKIRKATGLELSPRVIKQSKAFAELNMLA